MMKLKFHVAEITTLNLFFIFLSNILIGIGRI